MLAAPPDGVHVTLEAKQAAIGSCCMRIDALVTDFQKVTLEDDFEVR